MNKDIHNENVSSFKNRVNAHEKAIIDGSKAAHELNEFIELHNELEGILDDYINLTVNDSNYMEQLESYLKEELDYLNLISSLMDNLDKHHDSLGTIDAYTITKEWEDVKYLVTISNLDRSMIRLQYLKQNYPERFNQDLYNEMEEKYYVIGLRALQAQENMMNIIEQNNNFENDYEEENSMGDNTINNLQEEGNAIVPSDNDLLVNESLLEQMEVDEQIKYFEKIMKNIENVRGKSRLVYVDGEKKKIAKKYANRYMGYVARLNNLYNKDIIEEQDLINQISNSLNSHADLERTEFILENEAAVEKYCAIREAMDEIYRQEAQFVLRASGRPLNEVVEQIMLDGKPGRILMEDIVAYDELADKANALQAEFDGIMSKYGVTPNNNLTKGEEKDPEERKEEILDQIYFLLENGEKNEKLDSEIKALMDEYRSLETHEKLDSIYKLRRFFKIQGFEPKDCKYLAKITLNPEELQNNKNVSDEKKKNIFTTILNKFKKDDSKEKVEKQDQEEMSFGEKTKMNAWKWFGGTLGSLYATKLDIQDAYKSVTKAVKSIPSKAKGFVSKIKGTKKPVNKSYSKEEIKKRATRLAFIAGIGVVLYASAMSHGKGQNNNYTGPVNNDTTYETEVEDDTTLEDIANQMGAEIADRVEPAPEPGVDNTIDNSVDDNVNEEVEQDGVYIGDVFTIEANSPIYTNMYDAANETNGLNPYFADDSKREVTGIAYEYNGTMVMLDMNDPDFEAKKVALESNGAKPVAVRSENEASKGHEGYYNLEDVEIELGGGLQR